MEEAVQTRNSVSVSGDWLSR